MVRLVIFYFTLFMAQSFFTAFYGEVAVPDLFLLAVLTLLWRIQPWQLVLLAYGVGLFQDLLGGGFLGLHAFGLAGGAMVALLVRAQLAQRSFFERSMAIVLAVAGKWLAIIPLLIWQSSSLYLLNEAARVAPVEAILTLLIGMIILPWAAALMERTELLRKELL